MKNLKQIEIESAIQRVIEKRKSRGASDESIKSYIAHLASDVWKKDKDMIIFLNNLLRGN